MEAGANQLIEETSPYLLQHARNPVAWRPWSAETLAFARAEDRPILLSIGYSACHWCHVMAHESFEDTAIATMMNAQFVNIKVDREERPDLDKIYQTAFQLMNRRGGGWPLTMFLDPDDLAPFFAGTYFPREPRFNMVGFGMVLDKVAAHFREHRDDVRTHAKALQEALESIQAKEPRSGEEPDQAIIERAKDALVSQYDSTWGGFGGAPKFPRPSALELLLNADHAESRERALHTLKQMGRGGLFDQIGGGFCRYCVDAAWRIPHFEKMLYDNGALLRLNAVAARLTGDSAFYRITAMTAEWLIDTMQSGAGGFYASLDADSEGGEGRYYLWTVEQIRAALSADEFAMAERYFGLEGTPNFEGRWHLNVAAGVARLADERGESENAVAAQIETIRRKLLAVRVRRTPPGRDDKILTAWNGLAIYGLAAAGRMFDESRWLDSATRAVDFIHARLWRDGRLAATCQDGRARFNGYLDDYAYMAIACLELLRARWRSADLAFARDLCEAMLAHFEDRDKGGFWFTSDDHEALLDRPKTYVDESMAAGNGVAAEALIQLGHLLGDIRYLDAAARTLRAGAAALAEYPDAMCATLVALRDEVDLPPRIILRGAPEVLTTWRREIDDNFDPRRRTYAIPDDVDDLPGLLGACESRAEGVAYLCQGTECSRPLTRIEQVWDVLK